MKQLLVITMLTVSILIAQPALAQTANCDPTLTAPRPNPPAGPVIFNPDLGYKKIKDCLPVSNFDDFTTEQLITQILDVFSLIIVFLAVIGLLMSGIMYITAAGDPDKVEKAKKNIGWIIIGIVLYMVSLLILPYTKALILDQVAPLFNGVYTPGQ